MEEPVGALRKFPMEDLEKDIQKHLLAFCKTLPFFVETWKTTLKEAQNTSKALANYAEQLRCVEDADIHYMDNFIDVQRDLKCNILECFEEELAAIKIHVEKLKKANHDLTNKLSTLEQATLDLDWEIESPLLKGTPIQPPLKKILQMAYEFWMHFFNVSKNINEKLTAINYKKEKSVQEFEQTFCLDLENPERHTELKVYLLLALTQYIVNEKTVI